jgi:hypothetical protein
MALTAFGQQLPEPLLYFPLDEASGATAAVDKTGNGYDGVVVNSVTFGEEGAPGGSSPIWRRAIYQWHPQYPNLRCSLTIRQPGRRRSGRCR